MRKLFFTISFLIKFHTSCEEICESNFDLFFFFINLPISQFAYFMQQNLPILPEFAYFTRICLFHQKLPISPGLNSDPETIRRLVQGLDIHQFSNLTLELLALLNNCLDSNWSSFWHMACKEKIEFRGKWKILWCKQLYTSFIRLNKYLYENWFSSLGP